ncbi:MAG: Mur ligase family protein [bacterium]|jgi:UDP-N-acetylmuramoyl-tripeptide--D-alanyl-D-alanine ligase|nr:Mur ligase family protein [bacterium]
MKQLIQDAITKKARELILEHKPIIVTVSGSVGKTSARNAIVKLLRGKYSVRTTFKNYNNEFGVPLTILGHMSPGKSVFGWLKILLSKPKDIPEVFVLEYGIDHPGDMEHLCRIAKPDISVLTRISPVHVEHFESLDHLAEEKAVMIERTKGDGLVVLNADDPHVSGMRGLSAAEVVTYGFSENADVHVKAYATTTRHDYSFEPGEEFSRMEMHVQTQEGDLVDVNISNMLGKASASALLPAIAVAKHLNVPVEVIEKQIKKVRFEPGRMNILPGIKGSLIIDSSYNAAPASMIAALETLAEFNPAEEARRIAVLGHMAELGPRTEEEHRMLGMRVTELGVAFLVTVGEMTLETRQAAIESGMPESHTAHFGTARDAGRWLDQAVKKGDVVLIKGSQSARMEIVVKDIMAEPLNAPQLLVRQSEYWKNK